jgi:hypothetical protein
MQISRHWRLKSQRYRLEGVRYANGEVSLQARPMPLHDKRQNNDERSSYLVEENIVAATAR